jgi:hypothetical protein
MAEEAFDLRPDEARLLLNVALMATGKNFFKSATKILAALEGFRPGEESVGTAKVILMISIGEFEMAVDYIDREALVKWPDSAMLRAFRGMALIRMGRRACELFRDTRMLTETGGGLSRLNARMILDCARDGDPRAMTVFQEYVRYLATVIDGMIVLLESEMIILGGGVSRAGSFLLDAVSAQLPRWEADEKRPDIPVRAACLGNEAGMIGAALLGDV